MISRAVKAALENQSKNRLHYCPREDSFVEMYQVQGDSVRQEEIRLNSRDKAHCPYLQQDPNACLVMPDLKEVPEKYRDKPCFNNPYVKEDPAEQKQVERMLQNERLLNEANILLDACRLGLIESLDHLQAGEFAAVRHVLHWEITKKLEIQMRTGLGRMPGNALM